VQVSLLEMLRDAGLDLERPCQQVCAKNQEKINSKPETQNPKPGI
jgi:hypothetical protein